MKHAHFIPRDHSLQALAPVFAWIVEGFAIHRTIWGHGKLPPAKAWTLSHVPTGGIVSYTPTRRAAFEAARALAGVIDWTSSDREVVNDRIRARFTADAWSDFRASVRSGRPDGALLEVAR